MWRRYGWLLLLTLCGSACTPARPVPCVVPVFHLWTIEDPAPATLAARVARAETDHALTPIRCQVQP